MQHQQKKKYEQHTIHKTVVDNFLSLFNTKREAVDYINQETSRSYTVSSTYYWADPARPGPSQEVYEIMVRYVLLEHGKEDAWKLIRMFL